MLKNMTESEKTFVASTAFTCAMVLMLNAFGTPVTALFATATLMLVGAKVIWGYKHGAAKPQG